MTQTTSDAVIQPDKQQEIFRHAAILIVDDTALNRLVLVEMLKEAGFSNFIEAENGAQAIDLARSHKPDLIVLDLVMPVMDGFAVCKAVREDDTLRDIPVLVQTTLSGAEQRSRALKAGASDIISKPTNAEEIVTRCFIHLERRALMEDLRHYKKKMEKELAHAQELQKTLLPNREKLLTIEESHRMRVQAYFHPSSQIGGDFWGVRAIDDDRLVLYMVDLSGHGIYSALNTFRLDALIHSFGQELADLPHLVLEKLNHLLVEMLPTGQFATMFYGVFDHTQGLLQFATAAPPSPILINRNGVQSFSGQGFPLGVTKKATYELQKTTLSKEDKFLLYSDALTEVENQQAELLGEETLLQTVQEVAHQEGPVIMSHLLDLYQNYLGPHQSAQDDLTITLYEYLDH